MNWHFVEHNNLVHPLKDARWVKCVAHIRNNKTGGVRRWAMEDILPNDEEIPRPYQWEEGNYNCDCNRGLFYAYAADADLAYGDIEHECGNGGFSVNLENPAAGEIYFREYE